MPRKLILLILLVCGITLYADDLDEKVRQLQRLQSELEAAQQKAAQTSAKKKQTESEIKRTSSLKRITDGNLKKYQAKERVLRDSLSQVEQRLVMAEERLGSLHFAQNQELNILMRVDRSFKPQSINHRDHRMLKRLIEQNSRSINIVDGFKASLESTKELTRREAAHINRSLRNEDRKSRDYNKKIQNLNTQTRKLTNEEKALQTKINKLKTDAAALEGLINRLMADTGRTPSSYQFTKIKILWPVRGKIIRNFGQETRSYGTSVVSNGIDIAVKEGTSVVAVDDGEVIFSDRYGGQGKLIIIDHKNGYFSLYAYNSDLVAAKGAKVKRGQTIARSGMTGSASEPSLHFELRKDGKAINPVPYFE
ncbi:MAG: peptidoglycan DD-metalloendopeptidase family protein [Candidatus Cloacimonetes bacterium]|nr:peptidoglycan DD-metalloendopeptidase family protein [Candidatus Cloacimonadota bacterium]